jgi:hypothetical protein
MLCNFILWRGDAVVKGTKRKERGEETRATAFFHIDIFYYVTPTWPPFPVFFSHTHLSVLLRCKL